MDGIAGTLLIRADARSGIGAGHVMRCLALAQAWRDGGGRAHFLLGGGSVALAERLRREGMDVTPTIAPTAGPEDASWTRDLARRLEAAAVVLDGYPFSGGFQESLEAAPARLLVIDDNGECAPYAADLILNQNIHAREDWYRRRRPGSGLLLGTRYALLRKEFREAFPDGVPDGGSRAARRILVTMGGGDPDNATLRVIRALLSGPVPGLEARVVVGMVNPNLASLEAALAERPGSGITLERDVRDMPALMAWADLAVAAAGSTVWELLYAGLPSLLAVVADNQRDIASAVDAAGAAVNLGWHADLAPDRIAAGIRRLAESPEARAALSRRGRELVDGRGAARVAAALAGGGEG